MFRFLFAMLAIVLTAAPVFAATSAKVYMRDEGLTETNISKPRIYVENNGTTTLTDFVYYYYFTTENAKTPVLEDYYTPECAVSLEQINVDFYRVKYLITGANLTPGGFLPGTGGNVIGLHYNDWSGWNKTNDYSNSQSSTFSQSTTIPLYVNGTLITGTEPSGGGSGGVITREVWTNVSGIYISAIPVTTPFNSTGTLSSLEGPVNWADNYGARIRGYITAPATGTYYFWIAGDDCCELRLSTNDRPENKSPIASVNGYTNYRQWDKYTSQKSAAISLTAGQKYYVEVLHKEGSQGDNVSVGWAKPGQSTSAPSEVIPGSVLAPFVSPNATPSLTAALASPTQINLSWTDACTNEDGFRIERSVSGGAYSQIADLTPNTTTYQNTGLSATTTYSYRVRAYNSQGYSAWSNVFTLTTQEATSGSVVREVWTGITGTDVSAIPTGTTPNSTTTLTSLLEPTNVGDNFGTRIRGYIQAPSTGSYTFWISGDDDCEFRLSTSTATSNVPVICNVDGYTNALEWNKYTSQKSAVKTLTAGNKYYFEILHKENAQNDNMAVGWAKPNQGTSAPSEVIPGSVLWKFVAPVAPANLAATAASGTQINLTWSDYSDNEENFIVEQSIDGTNFTQIASKSADVISHAATGLFPATTYYFKVKALNSAGSSVWSAIATASTQATTAGAISRQVWLNIPTNNGVAGIPVATSPNSEGSLSLLQEPSNVADAFGTRVLGYLTAPTTGAYTFWISGDNDCSLRLSTDENPDNKTTIAYFTGFTSALQWNKFGSQKSNPITLIAGKRYYIEVLHMDIAYEDHMAVGWSKPGEASTAPSEIIPGSVLSLFAPPAAPSALVATTISSTQIDLSWTDNSDNETGFLIEGTLAGQTFAQIDIAPANANAYAVTGLTTNSQYQFRIRAANYAGSSVYTATATAVTNPPGDQEEPEITPELLSFAIYSQDLSLVKDSSIFSGGGAVGSNTLVQIEPDAIVNGNIVSGGNAELKDRVNILGNVTCAGTLTKAATATVSGTITENASVTIVDIPTLPAIPYGTTNLTVEPGQSITLQPGSYKNVTINTNGTITFIPGYYTFKNLEIDSAGIALFDVPMDKVININVETTLGFKPNAIAKFPVKGYAPCVKIYTNAYIVDIEQGAQLTGILTAPQATVHIYSQVNVKGAIYAKNIQLEPNAIFISDCVNPNADNDGDGIPNLTEMVIGDAPDDGEDFTMMGVPDVAAINNTAGPVTVYYNFDGKYRAFPVSLRVSITYPQGSLDNPGYSPVLEMLNKPKNVREFDLPDYKIVGNYMCMTQNELQGSVQMGLPLFASNQPSAVSRKIAYFSRTDNEWKIATGCFTSDGAMYGYVYDATAMIIIETETGMTAYLDNGMVYSSNSSEAVASVETYIAVQTDHIVDPNATVGGQVAIQYYDFDEAQTFTKSFDLYCYNYKGTGFAGGGRFSVDHKIKVTSITVVSTDYLINYPLDQEFTIEPGQSVNIFGSKPVSEFNSTKVEGDRISVFYNANSLSFESLAFGEGVIKKTTDDTPEWFYHYYLKDHLGSTRMVVADNGQLVDATMYHPYGKMEEVAAIGNESVRERFTTKEYDQDGAVFGQLEIDINLDFALNPAAWNRIGVYFSDAPNDPLKAEIITAEIESGTNHGRFKGTFNYPVDKTIAWIHFVVYDEYNQEINCAVQAINEDVGPGTKLKITQTISNAGILLATVLKTFLTYTRDDEFKMAGIGAYYFGARYYDAETGTWTACDKAGQFVNPYGYGGNGSNPIIIVDEDGNFFWIPVLIGIAMGAYSGYQLADANNAHGGELFAYMFMGALFGGLSGGAGSAIAGAGFIGSGTLGLVASSTISSFGNYAMSNGQTDFSTNFGFGAMNWSEGKFMAANPFQSNKSFFEKAMDVGGLLTPAGDIMKAGQEYSKAYYGYRRVGEVAAERFKLADQVLKPSTYWGQEFTGPGPLLSADDLDFWKRMAKIGVPVGKNSADYQALLHDMAYQRAGAVGGVFSALFDKTVVLNDLRLSLGSTANLMSQSGFWQNLGQASAFGLITMNKSASLLNASMYNY